MKCVTVFGHGEVFSKHSFFVRVCLKGCGSGSRIRKFTKYVFISGSKVAVDATHVEARDASLPARSRKSKPDAVQSSVQMEHEASADSTPPAAEPEPTKPKKRGCRSKEERDQWLQEQADI